MAARHQARYDAERTNDYFLDGEGISREVIQADICRYLGNDALVRPTQHQGRHGFLITAYRNLTSNMITDLKADSARWEQDVSRRTEQGYSRGSYNPGLSVSQSPNNAPGNYVSSTIHDSRQQVGPSPVYTQPPPPTYDPVYTQQPPGPYGSVPSSQGYSYPPNPAYQQSPSPYPPQQAPYGSATQSQPPVSAPDMHSPAYTHHGGPGYQSYQDGRPRFTGQGDEYAESDYPPVSAAMGYATSGMSHPSTMAPDMRIGGDMRYEVYQQEPVGRNQQTRDQNIHRRGR